MVNVYDTLRESAKNSPHNIVVIDEYGKISFAELFHQTEQLKNYLLSQNIKQGIAVGIITKNSRYFIISLYAVIGCGALAMPISHTQKNNEIKDAITEAQLHFIISDTQEYASLSNGVNQIEVLSQQLFISSTNRNINQTTADFISNPAFMRFTSGTTGKSKGVIVSHQSVIERIEAANELLQLNENDRVVWVLPMAYHFIVSIVLYIKYGVGIIVNNIFLADSIIESITKHNGTFLYAAPMHIKLLANHKSEIKLPSLKKVISTTTAISADVCKAFEEKFNLSVSQAYGIIEIGLPIINTKKTEQTPEAVGYALPAYEVGILDDELKPLPNNTIGQLAIKGKGMFDGYLSPSTKKENVLQQGWFLTGDYALREDNGLIIIKGRIKSVINVSGNKVFPNEIENIVNTYPNIIQSKAYSKLHPLLGEVVALDIIIKPNSSIDKEQLRNFCKNYLSTFKLPQYINVVDKIEMTDSGKIKR